MISHCSTSFQFRTVEEQIEYMPQQVREMVGSSVEFQSQVSICFTSCRLIYSILVSVEIGG